MEQLLVVLVLILASGDIKGYTSYSIEWDAAKTECRKQAPKYHSHRYKERDIWTSKCARGKLRKLNEVKP